MATLRADEHRYFLAAAPEEAARARRIPACRWSQGQRAWQLPRQPGAIRALDMVFGPGAWAVTPDLAQEVAEARGREYGPANHPAHVSLVGGELSVACAIGLRGGVSK